MVIGLLFWPLFATFARITRVFVDFAAFSSVLDSSRNHGDVRSPLSISNLRANPIPGRGQQ
jgi:hypothetical protein